MNTRGITLRYSSIDRVHHQKEFNDLDKAKAWAQHWIGAHPEIGRNYAISGDGIGKIQSWGCTLEELFPCKP